MVKAIVSLSGGMDSATVLAAAIEEQRDILCVAFRYGSKHNRWENEASRRIADHYNLPHKLIDFTEAMLGMKSALLSSGGPIPEGHHEDESMRQTVVPARNLIFTSFLAGLAFSEGAEEIWLGVHAGDHYIYPDCRPGFVQSMEDAIRLGVANNLRLKTPFLYQKKNDILEYGMKQGVPYHLTRTCYKSQEVACGKCGSCRERIEAFQLIGQADPIVYEPH